MECLPPEILNTIYNYDDTKYIMYNKCMQQIKNIQKRRQTFIYSNKLIQNPICTSSLQNFYTWILSLTHGKSINVNDGNSYIHKYYHITDFLD